MSTPGEIINMVASLMNDTAQTVFTDAACLPYLNIAIDEMLEIFEQNNIPITNEVSAVITVPIGTTAIGFTGGVGAPILPAGLIEIQQLWESPTGNANWIPMVKKEFLPHYMETQELNQFLIWTWQNQEIRVPLANQIIDLKIDYIRKVIVTPIIIDDINDDIPIINIKSYLGYHTGALCAMFISENATRAEVLEGLAGEALFRTLGISTKGKQSITTRRRPFRSSYKTRGRMW